MGALRRLEAARLSAKQSLLARGTQPLELCILLADLGVELCRARSSNA
jgi:hypothetical protein